MGGRFAEKLHRSRIFMHDPKRGVQHMQRCLQQQFMATQSSVLVFTSPQPSPVICTATTKASTTARSSPSSLWPWGTVDTSVIVTKRNSATLKTYAPHDEKRKTPADKIACT